ncbi:polysaccharide lyase family 7 protein [Solimonas marina]|uniref:Polysaccharide lyase family 7 protein n=1 Tax=Solimonas marina TaxID=2714601 RepID=A0A970B857_9GAMM|nr:polysaccharide lyase family 7 protein [Solimonas marina]NKF21066.1 polysaccharide lyase family 7 protein [Solimonas marina]
MQRLPHHLLLAASLALTSTVTHAASSTIALSHWKLTLPVDGQGRKRGDAAEIPPQALSGGYQSIWFHPTRDGSLLFWAPVDGATTSGSDYPRSELRELLDPNDDDVNWHVGGYARMTANCEVLGVPSSTGKIVIGQIHAFDGPPLVKLRYLYKRDERRGRLDALVHLTPDGDSTSYPLATDLPLKQAFDYRIEVSGGALIMQAGDGAAVRLPIDASWNDYGFYFKAGVYVQANGRSALDGGRVEFHALQLAH